MAVLLVDRKLILNTTQHKNKSDLNTCKKFCYSIKETRQIENIPVSELDLLLIKFFILIREQNGSDYEPATLSDFQRIEVFLFDHIINILLTELGRSVWENLDLGHEYRPRSVCTEDLGQKDSPIQIDQARVTRTK